MALIDAASRAPLLLVNGAPAALSANQPRPAGPAKAQRYVRSPGTISATRIASTCSPGAACAAAATAMAFRSSRSPTAASLDSAHAPEPSGRFGAGVVRAAGADLRPLRDPPLTGTGSALAALPRLARRRRPRGHRPRRRDR